MARYLLAAFAVFLAMPADAHEVTPRQAPAPRPQLTTDWVGFAASPTGRVFMHDGGTEPSARESARAECERATLRSCNAISVQSQTDVYVARCQSGAHVGAFLGGSNINIGAAIWIANDKAKRAGFEEYECQEVYRY